jgi:hypothetical protein
VHAKSGCGVYFNDAAAAFGQRLGNVRGDDVDARNVEPDDACDAFEKKDVRGMNFVRIGSG